MKKAFYAFAWFIPILGLAVPLSADDLFSVVDHIVQQHLPYVYGSEDPRKGGLDCSGFVRVVLLQTCQIELPNQADEQLVYCREHGQVWDATSDWTPATLRPGDLIFFAGPDPTPRTSQVSHVMLYCGAGIMAGAQGKDWQVDGEYAGVGYYPFRVRVPRGVVGEGGERFLGHRRVFAYGRLHGVVVDPPGPTIIAHWTPHPHALFVDAASRYD